MAEKQKHIFISYCHEDRVFARKLMRKLKEANFEIWIDNVHMHGGDDWRETIDDAIKNAFALIVIMTPNAKASDYVTYEWAYAWGAGVKVIPVLYKETNLHPRLGTLQHVKFTNPRTRRWEDLNRAVRKITNQEVTVPFPPQLVSKESEEDFEILRKEIVYEYGPDGKSMVQRKHLEIRILKDHIKSYGDKYRWTGKGKCNVTSPTKEFKIINQHKGDEGLWDYFDVAFPHPMKKNDVVTFAIEWELFDEEGEAKQFLATVIDRKTESLLLQVKLPSEPKRAYFYEYENYTDEDPLFGQLIHWSFATKSLSYEIIQPQKKHKYLIKWFN